MKIKRFVAPDMRQALRMVRETLGEDAVILSNKSIDEGVELTAAIDLVAEELGDTSPARSRRREGRSPSTPRAKRPAKQAGDVPSVSPRELSAMREEMQNLRRWLQAELSSMSWHDLGQRRPHAQELFQRLMKLGLTPDVTEKLMQRVADEEDLHTAWRKAMFHLAGEIAVSDQEVLEHGGIMALVGPTGVGKTTTIAKLAARFALRHGHRNIALISTDNFRIGARDQLHTYGRILNVPVRTADNAEAMRQAVESLSDRRLVLIDTAGMGADSDRFQEQIETLHAAGSGLHTLLTLSATTEGTALERAIELFSAADPEACLLTKLDEAASLGGALSAVIHSGLPLSWLADGQRVPEDLRNARATDLVERAARLLDEHATECDPAYVALSYKGGRRHARI